MQAETWFERFTRQREERYRQERIERASWRKLVKEEGNAEGSEGEGASSAGEGAV
jgi:hypothetical protein